MATNCRSSVISSFKAGLSFCVLVWCCSTTTSAQSDSNIAVLARSPVANLSEPTTITVYRNDAGRSVMFDKAVLIREDLSNDNHFLQFRGNNPPIPDGAVPNTSSEPATLMLPVTMTTAERIGVYTVTVSDGEGSTELRVLISNVNAIINASEYSTVVSEGDSVTLRAVPGEGVADMSLRWRRDGSFRSSEGKKAFFLIITAQNSQVFECFKSGGYDNNVHAIMNLIVRGCPESKTGPGCGEECPRCFNGGVCSDETVSCLCPPGFSGDYCENVHGRNVFGQNAEYKCDNTSGDHGDGCQGAIICYPEPFGCICPAGYTGLDCMQECEDGKFGANCKQDCRCQDGVTCTKDTGECENNMCAMGWKGVNCQVEDPCQVGVFGDLCTLPCACASGDCSDVESNCTRGCAVPWTGVACDEDSGMGEITNLIYVKVNPGVATTVSCSAIRNPVLGQNGLRLMAGSEVVSSPDSSISGIGEKLYTRNNTWMVTLLSESVITVTCSIRGTSMSQSMQLIPYELLQYASSRGLLLSFHTIASTSMFVQWPPWEDGRDVGDGSVKEYVIEYREEGGTFTEAVRTSLLTYQFTGLMVDTLYEFRIVLVREGTNGDGPPSVIQTQKTLCGVPPSPTIILESINSRTASFMVEIPPMNQWRCSSITASFQSLSNRQWIEVQSLSPSSVSVDVSDLIPCTSYTFRVQIVNTADSAESQPVDVTTQPEALVLSDLTVSSTTTMGQLDVSWSLSETPQTNCVLSMYTVIYRLVRHVACTSDVIESTNVTRTTTSTSLTLSDLNDYAEYEVRVRADGEVEGIEMNEVGTTLTAAPSAAPMNISLTNISSTCLEFTWEPPPCDQHNGDILDYQYSLYFTNGTTNETVVSNSSMEETGVLLCGLIPYFEYDFDVRALTSAGQGPDSEIVTERTEEDVPPQIDPPEFPFTNASSLQLQWQIPNPPHGVITGYNISFRRINDSQSNTSYVSVDAEIAGEPPSYILRDLMPFTNYSIRVRANTRIGPGEWSLPIISKTSEGFSSSPRNLTVADKSKTWITIEWDIPEKPRGDIIKYKICYQAVERPYLPDYTVAPCKPQTLNNSMDTPIIHNITSLDPSTVYRIEVSAYTSAGQGDISNITVRTDIENDFIPVPVGDITPPTRDRTSATISLPPLTDMYATHYFIRVRVPQMVKRSVGGIGSNEENPNDYITAEIEKGDENESFTIGDGQIYGIYHNAPLEEGKEYEIYVGTGSRVGQDTEVVWSEPLLLPAVAVPGNEFWYYIVIAVVVLVLLVVLIIGIIRIRRRGQKQTDNLNEGTRNPTYVDDAVALESPQKQSPKKGQTAIKVSNLALYVKERKESPTDNFFIEYETLPDDQLHSWDVGSKTENHTKNRYRNIIPYDNSRVVLEVVDGDPHSDYFNASYVDGYNARNKFIASHGPNRASVVDFWRLIWQEDCGKIVMVTPLKEEGKKKCEKYWPDESITYGNFVVVCKSVEEKPNYTLRTLFISMIGGSESRTVRHFHFTGWKDMKVPESPEPLLEFLQVVRKEPNPRIGPIVVHCSAGVGRTGTYIALDAMLDMAAAEKKVDVYQFICQMRQRRTKLVQVPEQYQFIFDALVKFLVIGNTSLKVDSFRVQLSDLKKINQDTKQSYLHDQFKNLEMISVTPDQFLLQGAKQPENRNKNRFPTVLPVDSDRPYLMTEVGGKGNMYINASFVSGFKRRDMFLATQMPLENTILDFWRLVWDYKSNVIVMLNDMPHKSNEQYWPDSAIITFGPFTIQLLSKDERDDMVVSRFEIYNTALKYQNFRTILHLRCLGWPEQDLVPPSPETLLQLISKINTWQLENEASPIMVHCIDGIGRTGVLCSLISAIDQAKAEQKVDILQIVYNMRKARPNMVQNLEQYQCIFDTLLMQLENSSSYQNVEI